MKIPVAGVALGNMHTPPGPFGAKAIAEIPKDGVASALASAVFHATGVMINQIPFTPERVWSVLQAAKVHA